MLTKKGRKKVQILRRERKTADEEYKKMEWSTKKTRNNKQEDDEEESEMDNEGKQSERNRMKVIQK